MKGVVINDKQIKEKVRREIEKHTQRVIRAGQPINEKLRINTISNWYSEFKNFDADPTTMITATRCGYETHWVGDTLRYVVFYSGVDLSAYKPPESLHRQSDIYSEIYDDEYYVLHLQLDQGILGLPKYFTYKTIGGVRQRVRTYENPYFGGYHKPLYKYTKNVYNARFKREFNSAMRRWN